MHTLSVTTSTKPVWSNCLGQNRFGLNWFRKFWREMHMSSAMIQVDEGMLSDLFGTFISVEQTLIAEDSAP